MGYNIIDLLEKAIKIAKRKIEILEEIRTEASQVSSINGATSVLIKIDKENIGYFQKIICDCERHILEDIDFAIYDKVSFLINEFNRRLIKPEILEAKELLSFCLEMEKQVFALYIDIQGRLIKNEEDSKTMAYNILSEMIKKKEKHIKNLNEFVKG